MDEDVLRREAQLHREADEFLGPRGLRELLAEYGEVHVDGSYALKLMTWRDLDIYLVSEELHVRSFFELGRRLADMLLPVRMSYRNEHIARSPELPNGLYWGVHLGNERKGAWKMDIWAVQLPEYDRLREAREQIAIRLTDQSRQSILLIKDKCWRDRRYRNDYTSMDIYQSVLDDGVKSVQEFDRWLLEHKGFGISPSP